MANGDGAPLTPTPVAPPATPAAAGYQPPNLMQALFSHPGFSQMDPKLKWQTAHQALMRYDPDYAKSPIESKEAGLSKIFAKYDKPADWQEDNTRRSAFAPDAAFTVRDGNQSARVTVFRQAGDLLANVNRWRTLDLKMPELSPAEVERLPRRQRIEVDGQAADFVDLLNADAPNHPRVLGVVLPRRGTIWTFTMKGPAELLEKQKPAFEAFVKSVRFAGGTGAADE